MNGNAIGSQAVGNFPQGFVGLDRAIFAVSLCLLHTGRRRSRLGFGLYSGFSGGLTGGRFDLGCSPFCHGRRIQQCGIFPYQLTIWPVNLDEEVEERLSDGFLTGNANNRLAIFQAHGFEPQPGKKKAALKPNTGKDVCGRQAYPKGIQ